MHVHEWRATKHSAHVVVATFKGNRVRDEDAAAFLRLAKERGGSKSCR